MLLSYVFFSVTARKSLVHELNECVSSRVLKLEKENRELQTSIERLKEDNHLLQEQQLHTQELDRENQSLSKKVRALNVLKPLVQCGTYLYVPNNCGTFILFVSWSVFRVCWIRRD